MKETGPDREETMPIAAPPEVVSQPAYVIDQSSPDEIVVRIRRGMLPDEKISRFLALLDLEAIREKSQLTEEAARELADEIDRAVWEKNRHRVSAAG
jgi:hypothetical protein